MTAVCQWGLFLCSAGTHALAAAYLLSLKKENQKKRMGLFAAGRKSSWAYCAPSKWHCAGFEKFNNMEQARFYHDEMVRAGMTPRASQSLDAGMSHADSSALRAAKPLVNCHSLFLFEACTSWQAALLVASAA